MDIRYCNGAVHFNSIDDVIAYEKARGVDYNVVYDQDTKTLKLNDTILRGIETGEEALSKAVKYRDGGIENIY